MTDVSDRTPKGSSDRGDRPDSVSLPEESFQTEVTSASSAQQLNSHDYRYQRMRTKRLEMVYGLFFLAFVVLACAITYHMLDNKSTAIQEGGQGRSPAANHQALDNGDDIDKLKKELEAIKGEIAHLKGHSPKPHSLESTLKDVRSTLKDLQDSVNEMKKQLQERRVKFIAVTKGPYFNDTMVFTSFDVISQPANIFDSDEGFFAVPRKGIYTFSFSGTCFARDTLVRVMANEEEIYVFNQHDSHWHWRECGQEFALQLEQGDEFGCKPSVVRLNASLAASFYLRRSPGQVMVKVVYDHHHHHHGT